MSKVEALVKSNGSFIERRKHNGGQESAIRSIVQEEIIQFCSDSSSLMVGMYTNLLDQYKVSDVHIFSYAVDSIVQIDRLRWMREKETNDLIVVGVNVEVVYRVKIPSVVGFREPGN